jgi:hypothetical protein
MSNNDYEQKLFWGKNSEAYVKNNSVFEVDKALELYTYFCDQLKHTFSEEYSVRENEIVKTLAFKVCDEVIASTKEKTTHTFWVNVKNALLKM